MPLKDEGAYIRMYPFSSLRRALGIFFVVMVLACSNVHAAADTLFLAAFPELRQSAAPDWVVPGLRITYRSSSLSKSADKNSGTLGYYQVDISSVSPREVIWMATIFNEYTPGMPEPFLNVRGDEIPGIGETWVHPSALKVADRMKDYDGMQVLRGPYTINGKTYQAVRFEYADRQMQKSWTYDEATGLLLRYSHDIQTGGGSQYLEMLLVGTRNVVLPGMNKPRPAWVTQGTAFQFSGTYSSFVSGILPYSMPYVMISTIEAVDADYSKEKTVAYQNGQLQGEVATLSTSWRVGGYWLAPEALAALRPGTVLDTDVITNTRTVVASSATGTGGQPVILLQQQASNWSNTYGYDVRTGRLVYFKSIRPIGTMGRLEIELYARN